MRKMTNLLQYGLLFALAMNFGMSTAFARGQQPQAQQPAAPQPAPETRSGCLIAGDSPGTFVLVDEPTGQRIRVEGTNLAPYQSGRRANVTGTVVKQGGTEIFRITKVEDVADTCGAIGFSSQALKDAVGRATIGIRGGIAADPELITFGGQAQLGPIFRNIWFRPTAEFAFGEVTKVFSLNADFAYYLPFIGRGARDTWTMYVGAGPSFAIVQRDFEGFPDQPEPDVEADWDGDTGLSFFVGAAQSNGLFFELKAHAYATPTVRLYIGYNFR
jgi:hypothetical protein